jgi:serine/threonine protein kinase
MEIMGDGADPRAHERVGSVLDEKWTLEHLIGAGGMGAVYAARHRNGARAAVKILHPELARIPEVRERFLREGLAANKVEHRGVVQVLDDGIVKTGADEGSAYLVMELLEGESLQERVARSPKLGEHELLEVMDAVLDVLGAAHEHGVVHRDLKPENIFLARDPEREGVRVKVLDFGLARIAEAASVTNAGMAVGTPSFMSPEQAAGRSNEIDGRTDIFALGATIFRILTGRRIHEIENMVQLVVLMATEPAPPLRSVKADVSSAFARIVDRALAFERSDRYPNAASMREDVRALLEATEDAATLGVIPFSARNVRVGSVAESDPPRAKATTKDDLPRKARSEEAPAEEDSEEAVSVRPARRPIAKASTLPWAIVLVLLAIGAWKLGPSLQEELVRRASLEPVRKLWTADSASSQPPDPAPPASTVAAETAPDAAVAELDEDVTSEDDVADAGAVTNAIHDAGHPRPITTARPHPPAPPHGKPTPKKPPPKKPPRDWRHR